jgi:molybdopterin/thiamine biosynthesis adenylyltransferase
MHKHEVYLASEEVSSFLNGSENKLMGFSYEWEGENVIHLHSHPLQHSFGLAKRCLFTKESNIPVSIFDEQIKYIVSISKSDNHPVIKVYTLEDNNVIEISAKLIPGKDELYSRSKGLIEVEILSNKHVAIVGLGSFGSQIAIELAKAGVGSFSIFDFDRVELHNIGRHTCTLKDLGRLKTDAIEEAILGKNPYAKIYKHPINIASQKDVFNETVKNVDLVICATDNNDSRFIIASALHTYQKIGIFGRAITRAAGGDVFRYRPGGPCYGCLIGSRIIDLRNEEVSSEEAGRRSGAIPAYASAEDVNAIVQVGLSIDIEPICNFMLKLAILELSKGMKSGISSLEEDLKYDAYIWANRRDNNFSNWHSFYKSGPKQTILKWYGITIPKDEHCAICSETPILDTGLKFKKTMYAEYADVDFHLDEN